MRILCLHGYQTSAKILMQQSKYLRTSLQESLDIEWIIPDAPHKSKGKISPLVTSIFKPPYYHWYEKNNNYQGLEETIEFLKENVNSIDGILGFSQGACVAQILAPIIKPKFVINICGVNYPEYKNILEIPCLNVIGSLDPIKERSELLALQYKDSEILYHLGSHSFPPDKPSYQEINNFIKKF